MAPGARYNDTPTYPVSGSSAVQVGYGPVAARICAAQARVVAIDGPWILDWDVLAEGLAAAVRESGRGVRIEDMRRHFRPWPAILQRTASSDIPGDQHFARLADGMLADLLGPLPAVDGDREDVTLVIGPGSALAVGEPSRTLVWYADLPKRFALERVQAAMGSESSGGLNLGQPPDLIRPGGVPRLLFIDWPLLDRHRDTIAPQLDGFIDLTRPDQPRFLDGSALRASMSSLAHRPFRTRPTYLAGSWGGHWAQRVLGVSPGTRNVALVYELIAPESSVLLGSSVADAVEVPFQLLVAAHPDQVLGPAVAAMFGTSFPIRFDYLDTVDGGTLSVHVHPRHAYMQQVFGWSYTQHETYYVLVTRPGARIYLGLADGVDLDAFRRAAELAESDGRPFDIEQYVQTFPADHHQLFLIPAGTPHASGEGNVVLEVSATPYLYSLRFYDWLRRDHASALRPVHVQHAFANLNLERTGSAVARDLVPAPRLLRQGRGYAEFLLASLPEMFFEVRRLEIEAHAEDRTGDRFHVLNLVEGEEVLIETEAGHRHPLAYAETIVVPAAVGGYTIDRRGGSACRLVKALVR